MSQIEKEILNIARERLIIHKTLRAKYPIDDSKFNKKKIKNCWSINCPWTARISNDDNFTLEDIDKCPNNSCKFSIERQIYLKGSSGIESNLHGKYLNQIIKLNEYVLTSASTNSPHNIYEQQMFVTLYAETNLANKIFEHFTETLENYSCVLFSPHFYETKYYKSENFTGFMSSLSIELRSRKKEIKSNTCKDYYGKFNKEQKEFIKKNYAFIDLVDDIQERRNLYKILIKFIEDLLKLNNQSINKSCDE